MRATVSNAWPPEPPSNETEAQKATRLEAERAAKEISDDIDKAIEAERQELRRNKPQTKVLLLGQAESGKSTMIKNFQLYFCPAAFFAEAEAWRTVIHLNLARFVNFLLHILTNPRSSSSRRPRTSTTTAEVARDVRILQMRLSPLKQVEIILSRALSPDGTGVATSPVSSPTLSPTDSRVNAPWTGEVPATEISIRSGSGWKNMMRRRRGSQTQRPVMIQLDELDDTRKVIDACKEDIAALWKTAGAEIIGEIGIDTHHHARYFLDDVQRVADIEYFPTTDDILRARLRTVGVEEYRLTMETAAEKGNDWLFYDVGGSRSQRTAWASYFDDVNAVVFLCPMSGFNQRLEEDRKVNRLADSLALWEQVCKSRLLTNATFILLLNKADVLFAKLKSGIQFEDYVSSYRGRPNKAENVAEYLRDQMIRTHRIHSPKKRHLHAHITCAVEPKIMATVLISIRDTVLVNVLQETSLL
ncbi:G-alpha-domain-containing protein [Epithele typhae]|uniref:G-alpha-domain-containing protein n=1 Tax=Epithele typhae TaxID=378194 RepID=UPI002008AB14|nr:G-alpha-domain-containing protein [Epithele typhae]KAH9942317.1 G-alpha-domain-containing protein [Epithele typhae]